MPEKATMPHMFQFGLSAALPSTSRFAVRRNTVGARRTKLNTDDHMAGTLILRSEDIIDGNYTVSGQIEFAPRPDELDIWLPWMTGGTFAGDVIKPAPLGDSADRVLSVDRKVKVFNYNGCRISQWTLQSRPGQLLTLLADVEGLTLDIANAGTFTPSLELSLMQPYAHYQAILTLDGTARRLNDVQLVMNHSLVLDRSNNSQTRTELPQGGRRMTRLVCNNPFTADEYDLFTMATQGVAGSILYTNGDGDSSLLIEFPRLEATQQDPEMPDNKTEMPLQLDLTARSLDGHAYDEECQITNVSGP